VGVCHGKEELPTASFFSFLTLIFFYSFAYNNLANLFKVFNIKGLGVSVETAKKLLMSRGKGEQSGLCLYGHLISSFNILTI